MVSWLGFGAFADGVPVGAGRGVDLAERASDDQAVENRIAVAILCHRVIPLGRGVVGIAG